LLRETVISVKSLVESEKAQENASAPAFDTPREAAGEAAFIADAAQRALKHLLQKRVKKFVALASEVRGNADPKIIHDVRVWSRRLQQAVTAFFPKPRSGKVQRLRRMPRRVRRALGEWRNCDVLLEMVQRAQRRTRSETKQRAWVFVREYLLDKRSKEINRAENKLCHQDLDGYADVAQHALNQSPREDPLGAIRRLNESLGRAWSEWQSALARAQETREIGDLHAFRIATKVVRYRTELLVDLGDKRRKAELNRLTALQEVIGVWHDRQVLHQAVAEAVARREVLLNELPKARVLLAEVEKQRSHDPEDVAKIFRLATEHLKQSDGGERLLPERRAA
jgi:CHAD domain-containing protein